HVDWKTRCLSTSSNMFMWMICSSLGAALLGGVLNTQLNRYLGNEDSELGQELSANSANTVLDSSVTSNMSEEALDLLKEGLDMALHGVYWGIFVFEVITLVLTIFLPKMKK